MNAILNGFGRWLTALAAVCLVSTSSRGEEVSFAGLPVDTLIADQFSQYLTFVPYSDIVTGIVVSSQWGNVVSFTKCSGGMECEFFTPGAKMFFKNTHQLVQAKVGALPAQIQFQIGVKLIAFDAGGTLLSSDTATVASNGAVSTLSVKSGAQNIASVVLEAVIRRTEPDRPESARRGAGIRLTGQK